SMLVCLLTLPHHRSLFFPYTTLFRSPLINIEQKRTDKTLDEAFRQFKRYYRDGEYTHNFLVFSQMMVITSEVATRYFATPKTIRSEEHTSELQSRFDLVCRLLLEKKN